MKTNVKTLRDNLGLSQGKLAEDCGVSRQTIYAVENGTFKPSVVLALKIARELGVSVEAIFILEKGD